MGSDDASSNSNTPLNCDEIFMHQKLHFSTTLKDLKNLRQQLYSAAEYFEVSYENDDQKQSVIETSKDYLSKAVVSTVDHLGSIADKLNKFLDDAAVKLSATNIRFYCIQERFNTFQELVNLRGVSRHFLSSEAPKHHKLYNSPGVASSRFGKPNLVYKDCIPCPLNTTNQTNQDNPFAKGFHVAVIKPQPLPTRKGNVKSFSCEHPRNPVNFAFTRAQSNKESVKHSDLPSHSTTLRRSGTVSYRSLSPSSSIQKHQLEALSEPGRSNMIMTSINSGMSDKERQITAYTRRSKNVLKALLSIRRSTKEMTSAIKTTRSIG